MPAFRLPTKLPRINCWICGQNAPIVDGRFSKNLLTMGSQARKRSARLYVSLWKLFENEKWTSCSFGGLTDSPAALHIWSLRSNISENVILILPPTLKASTQRHRTASWYSPSSRPSLNLSGLSLSNASIPAYGDPAPMENVLGVPLFPKTKLPRYSPLKATHPSGRSQLELAFQNQ